MTKQCDPKNVQPSQSGCLLQILTLEIFALHALIPCPEDLRKMLSDDNNRESRGQLQSKLLSLPGKILKAEKNGEKFHFLGVFHESGSVRSFICVILSNCMTPALLLSWENWVYETIWNYPKTTQHVHESCDFNLSLSATQTLPSCVEWWVSRLATSEIKALALFKHKFPQEDTYYKIVFLRFEYCADPRKTEKSSNILKFQSFVWQYQKL